MRIDRPPPGEELNTGEETQPRLAASVILLRDDTGGSGIEVLLVKRTPQASFMGGAWVFPGGSVHDRDGGPEGAAVRELGEEAAVTLSGTDALVPFSRWITPAGVKVRFDTWFYVAKAPRGVEPACDGEETVDLRWFGPAAALEAGRSGEILLVFPTIKHLEQLAELPSVDDAIATARERRVEPVLPRIVGRAGAAEVLLPGEPGYDG